MKKALLTLGALLGFFAIAMILPSNQYRLAGALRCESFYDGLPRSYWLLELELIEGSRTDQWNRKAPANSLVEMLKDQNAELRLKAALHLGHAFSEQPDSTVTPSQAISALVEVTKDTNKDVGREAAIAISHIDDNCSEALTAMVALLREGKQNDRRYAAIKLMYSHPPRKSVMNALREVLNDEDKLIRKIAADGLQTLETRKGVYGYLQDD